MGCIRVSVCARPGMHHNCSPFFTIYSLVSIYMCLQYIFTWWLSLTSIHAIVLQSLFIHVLYPTYTLQRYPSIFTFEKNVFSRTRAEYPSASTTLIRVLSSERHSLSAPTSAFVAASKKSLHRSIANLFNCTPCWQAAVATPKIFSPRGKLLVDFIKEIGFRFHLHKLGSSLQ